MRWSEGHRWSRCVPVAQLGNEFEYKYAIQDSAKSHIRKWENCKNRSFNVSEMERHLDSPEIAPYVTVADDYHFSFKIQSRVVQMAYNPEKEVLTLFDLWQL